MMPHICRCCGEPMVPGGNALSRNPNMCASCSSLADGMEEHNLPAEEGAAPRGASLLFPQPEPEETERQAVGAGERP